MSVLLYVYIYMDVRTYVCMYVCMYACIYICMSVCMYACIICMYLCMFVFMIILWLTEMSTVADAHVYRGTAPDGKRRVSRTSQGPSRQERPQPTGRLTICDDDMIITLLSRDRLIHIYI